MPEVSDYALDAANQNSQTAGDSACNDIMPEPGAGNTSPGTPTHLQLWLLGVVLPFAQIFISLFVLPWFQDSLSKPPCTTYTQLAVALLVPAINAALLQTIARKETLAPRFLVPLAGVACGIAAVYVFVFLPLPGIFSYIGYSVQALAFLAHVMPGILRLLQLPRAAEALRFFRQVEIGALILLVLGLFAYTAFSTTTTNWALIQAPSVLCLDIVLCLAVVALSYFGLMPLFTLITSLELTRRLLPSKAADAKALKGLALIGLLGGIGLTFVSDMRIGVTRFALNGVANGDPLSARAGLRVLKSFGSVDCLNDECHDQFAATLDLPALVFKNASAKVEDARRVYYRLNGESCRQDSYQCRLDPVLRNSTTVERWGLYERDRALASEDVGPLLPGLIMSCSTMKVVPSLRTGVARATWNLAFNNSANVSQEARTEILLPRNGVVSKVSILMHGSMQTADIEPRKTARAKYENVVLVKRRDPVLVTSTGPDKVLVQCFPVEPQGSMHIELQVDYPLSVDQTSGNLTLPLPAMAASNFAQDSGHLIVKGTVDYVLSSEELCHHKPAVVGKFSELSYSISKPERIANVKFTALRGAGVSNLYVVIDCSKAMKSSSAAIAAALGQAGGSNSTPIHLLLASDQDNDLPTQKSIQSTGISTALAKLHANRFEGGPDNLPALVYAADRAAQKPNSAVLWIHGPQPYLYGKPSSGEIAAFFSRIKDSGVQVCEYEAIPGPNKIVQSMEDPLRTKTPIQLVEVSRSGDTESDLASFIAFINGQSDLIAPSFSFSSESELKPFKQSLSVDEESSVLNLCAADRVRRLIAVGDIENATREAFKFGIVSPVTGAVKIDDTQFYASPLTGPQPYDRGLDGALRTRLVHQIEVAFECITDQLNRLNTTGGNAGGGGVSIQSNNNPILPSADKDEVSGLEQPVTETTIAHITQLVDSAPGPATLILIIVRLLSLAAASVCITRIFKDRKHQTTLQKALLAAVGLLTLAVATFGGFLNDFAASLF